MYLQKSGYKIIPINPKISSVLGEKSYPNLASVPFSVNLVNIFRKSEHVYPIIKDAINVTPQAIWMQLGVVNERAAELAIRNDIKVIMNQCIMKQHKRLMRK